MRLLNSSCYLLLLAILLVVVEACQTKEDKTSAKSYTYADFQGDSVWGYRDISIIKNEMVDSCSHLLPNGKRFQNCVLQRGMEAQQTLNNMLAFRDDSLLSRNLINIILVIENHYIHHGGSAFQDSTPKYARIASNLASNHLPKEDIIHAYVKDREGHMLQYLDRYVEAIKAYKEATQIFKNSPQKSSHLHGLIYTLYHLAWVHENLDQHDSAMVYLNEGLSLCVKDSIRSFNIYYRLNGNFRDKIGEIHYKEGRYETAWNYAKQSEAIFIKEGKNRPYYFDEELAWSYSLQGDILEAQGRYDEAAQLQQKANKCLGGNDPIMNGFIARAHHKMGDLYLANEFAHQSLDKFAEMKRNKEGTAQLRHYFTALNILAGIQISNGKLDSAIYNYQACLETFRQIYGGEQHFAVIQTHLQLGKLYLKKKEYPNAQHHLEKGLTLYQEMKHTTPNPRVESELLEVQSRLYMEMGNTRQALDKNIQCLKVRRKSFDPGHPTIATTYSIRGQILSEAGRFEEAFLQHRQAIQELFQRSALPLSSPHIPIEDKGPVYVKMLMRLAESKYQHYLTTQKVGDLQASIDFWEKAAANFDLYLVSMREEGSAAVIMNEYGKIYDRLVELNYELHKLTPNAYVLHDALKHCDRFKGVLLNRTNQQDTLQATIQDPDSLFYREVLLKRQLANYQTQLYEQRDSTYSSKQLYDEKINQLRGELLVVINELKVKDPDYYQKKYDSTPLSVSQLMQHVSQRNGSLIEYHYTAEWLYVFVVHKGQVQVLKKPATSIPESVARFRAQLESPESNAVVYNQFAEHGHQLYNLLLADALELIPQESREQLIIIPDGPLSLIPFEMLLTQKFSAPISKYSEINYRTLSYLFQEHDISYEYSAKLVLQNPQKPSKKNGKVFAFAPTFEVDKSKDDEPMKQRKFVSREAKLRELLGELPHTQKEVNVIEEMVGGTILKKQEATPSAFLKAIPQASILHLATHVLYNPDPRFQAIAFAKEDAKGAEFMYSQKLLHSGISSQAEMVVLSGCNSGKGKYQRGEGPMSWVRVFKALGSPNVVASLWSIEDQASAKFMGAFYKHLKSGMEKDRALNQARTEYLRANPKAPPMFWGAFVLYGSDAPVKFAKN